MQTGQSAFPFSLFEGTKPRPVSFESLVACMRPRPNMCQNCRCSGHSLSKIEDDGVIEAFCASSFSTPQCDKILVALGGKRIPPGRGFRLRACSNT